MDGGWGPWAEGIAEAERRARLRELRAIAWLLLGGGAPLVGALAAAERDGEAETAALEMIDRLPSRTRRKLLCTYAWLGKTR